jgi:hypothetical protein
METLIRIKNTIKKLEKILTFIMVISGTVIFSVLNRTTMEPEMVSRVFLVFMGAIITLQILPGLLTTSMSIRGGSVVRAKEAIRK